MNNTNSNYYDSTFYDTAKSKFPKPTGISFYPQNISTVNITKSNREVFILFPFYI